MVGWNSQLLEIGSELAYLRLKSLKKLAASLSKICSSLMGSVCSVHLTYTSSFLDAGDLGFSLEKMRKASFFSHDYWKWQYQDNPNGRAITFLAKDNGSII